MGFVTVASSDRCTSTDLSHHQQRGPLALQFGIWRDDAWPSVQTSLVWYFSHLKCGMISVSHPVSLEMEHGRDDALCRGVYSLDQASVDEDRAGLFSGSRAIPMNTKKTQRLPTKTVKPAVRWGTLKLKRIQCHGSDSSRHGIPNFQHGDEAFQHALLLASEALPSVVFQHFPTVPSD